MMLVPGIKCKIICKKRPEKDSSSHQMQKGEVLMLIFDRQELAELKALKISPKKLPCGHSVVPGQFLADLLWVLMPTIGSPSSLATGGSLQSHHGNPGPVREHIIGHRSDDISHH